MRKRNLLFVLFIVLFSIQLFAAEECKISACTYSNSSTYKIKFPDNIFIMIDPGHGGDADPVGCDSGGNSPLVDERDLVREIAKNVVDRLHSYGLYHIRATRPLLFDQTNEIDDKVETINDFFGSSKNLYDSICKDICCDPFVPILLSLHSNGGPASTKGAEQYYYFENDLPGLVQEVLDQIEESNRAEKIKNGTGLILLNQTIPILKDDYKISPYHTYCELGFIWNTNNYDVLTKRKKEVGKRIADRIMLLALNKGYRFSKDTEVGCRPSDNPDENYSVTNVSQYGFNVDGDSKFVVSIDLLTKDILTLLTKSGEPPAVFAGEFNSDLGKNHPIMVIPSGILAEKENDSVFKINLDQYVKNGGTIIVLGQQYGSNIDNVVPIPEGESLHTYGWREDQSCNNYAGYFRQMRPALAAMTSQQVNINVDGYFSTYPSSATVMLRRVSNQQPCLISYPYGNGTVILTTMYTDWGAAHSQASTSELRLVRDLVTYAKNPNLAIPMFNLHTSFHPDISLNVAVKNESENAVSKAKIKIYTPDRKTVLYETELPIALASGADGVIPISFNLSASLYSDNYGLCHTDYELYDADNNLVQMATEADSGRFGVHGKPSSYSPARSVLAWLTVENESIYSDEQPVFTLHVQNNTATAINPSFSIERNHQGPQPLFSMEVPANGNAEKTFAYDHQGAVRYWVTASGIDRISKGIQIKYVRFENSLKTNSYYIGFSNPISFQISSTNVTGKAVTGNIELKLLKGNQEIETLYSQVHEFGKDETFSFSGSHIPTSSLAPGDYRLKLSVVGFDGKEHSSYAPFSYFRSDVALRFESSPDNNLIPGQSYAVGFKIKNNSNFKINEGKYTITLKSASGVEEFRKEVTGVACNELQELSFSETMVFSPAEKGKHQLQILYTDETGTSTKIVSEHQYLMWARLSIPKSSYAYGEAIPLTATFNGAGQFSAKITATGCDFSYATTVELNAANNFTWSQQFDVPITVASSIYPNKYFNLTVKDLSAYCEGTTYGSVCSREATAFVSNVPIKLDGSGSLTLLGAQAGGTVDLALNVKGISGFIVPLAGDLIVSCGSLNFSETRAVSVSPGVDNPFSFQVTVPASTAAGTYSISMAFAAENKVLLSKSFPIYIPAPGMKLSEPPATLAAGAALPLDFVNDGGKDGNYTLALTLKDELGKVMLTHADTQAIAAGATFHLDLTVPDGLKSGKYTLKQAVGETVSGKSFTLQSGFTLSGLSATLNAYTLKEKYFDNETVAGKAEITAGGTIADGTLKAKIYRTKRGGITVFKASQYVDYSQARVLDGGSFGNKTYFVIYPGLVEYDRSTEKFSIILDFGSGGAWSNLYVTPEGELWLGTTDGGEGFFSKHRDLSGIWTQHVVGDGSSLYAPSDFIEYDNGGQKEIWAATQEGIAVLKNGAWSFYTTAEGLSSNYIYEFAKDGDGRIWVQTQSGVDRFNGTGFEAVPLSFDQSGAYSYYVMIPTSTGDIWFEVVNYDSNWAIQSSALWRYSQGNWSSRDLLTELPNIDIFGFREDDGELWFTGYDNNNSSDIVGKLESTFTLFSSNDIPEVANCMNIIPVPNSGGMIFGSDPGFVEFNGDMWQMRAIEIEDNENELLINDAYLMAKDNQGGVWIAGNTRVTHLNNGIFTNYLIEEENSQLGNIAAGGNGTAYAIKQDEWGMLSIVKIDMNGLSTIEYPEAINGPWNSGPVLGVDNGGRLWLAQNPCGEGCGDGGIFYYNGAWNPLLDDGGNAYFVYANKIISDGAGGIWIATGGTWEYYDNLIHVKNDLTIQEYNNINSGLAYGKIEDICLDSSGVLWILTKKQTEYYTTLQYVSSEIFADYQSEAVQTLQNDVFTLKAAYNFPQTTTGYPDGGLWGIAEAGAGNMVFAGRIENNAFHLYWLNGDELIADDNFFYTLNSYVNNNYSSENYHQHILGSGGLIYSIGDIEDSGEHNLLQMGANMQKVQVWSNEYPVNAASGETLHLDLLPGMTLAAGNYTLAAELTSALDQKLASSDYGFIVRGTAVAASISRSGSSDANVRNGSDAAVQFEVLNGTAEDKAALNLKITKVSPSGVETVLQDNGISLSAGASHSGTLAFNESENGVWKLAVVVSEAGTTLDAAELLLDVSAPAVTYEITRSEYAGDEAFPVKIKLSNTGKIPTNMHISVGATSGSPSYLNEDVALAPGEERMLSFTDTITADRVYDIAFTGDLAASEQKTVQYGYAGNLALTVLPQYREGTVSIGYTVANAGGLAFSDTLHFELYAAGNAVAIYTVDKTYNLYPGAEASTDALEFALSPGSYQLRWTSGHGGAGQSDFSILPSGIGQLAFAPAAKYPVGLTEFSYTLSNSDTVAGNIDLLIEIVPAAGGAAVYTLTRSHYLNAGESVGDAFSYDFTGTGSYIVRFSGAKIVGGAVSAPVKVLKLDEVTASVAVQPASGGSVPVQVQVANSGYNDFAGTLVIEAGGLRHEEPLQVLSEATLDRTFTFDANGLSSGSQEVIAYIYDAAGNILGQNTLAVTVTNSDIRVVEVPQNLTIAAGSFAGVALKVRNEGNKRGEAEITMTAFDTLKETRAVVLEAGEELELSDIFIDVDADIPAGHYPFNYTLSGLGVANGLATGNFNFQVTGIALNVSASLDRSLYNQGETAYLTIDVSSADAVTSPLEAVVNWNEFSERRAFTLESGSASLVFEIPLSEAGAAKVFYGIYRQEGRGIYLNDIYLNFAGDVSVTLDKQVYDPGDSIHALFAVGEAGSLTAECFGTSQTVAVGSSAGVDFAVPSDALGGSYGVAWTFTPGNIEHAASSGAKPFDVSGLVVKVARAGLEKGKYAPGDTIKAMLSLESNRDVTLGLRAWTVTPEAAWTYLGEQSTTLSAAQQTPAVLQYAFATTEAGTHRFVYGLYNGEQLVVSGAAAFDCGDAVLIGLAPDHLEYANGNETVKVKADHFGSGAALLELYLDDEVVDMKSVTLAGLGSTEIDLAAAQVGGGRHDLRAVMTKDGLTSTRRAWFTYGTNLPDLAVGMSDRTVNGLDYAFTVQVSNSGKTASAATALVFSDNDTDVQSAAINPLEPGAGQDVQFSWSGSGKAGSHMLRFTADRDNTIKEFAEANNVLEMNEEVPALFYSLGIDPQVWTANSSVSIFSTLINNRAADLPLLLHLTLTHNSSAQVILERSKNVTLVPFVQTVETDVFNTAIYPAGDYTLAQTAGGDAIERTEELAVYIEPTKIIGGSMTAVPATVGAGIDTQVTLKLSLSNNGNVALESEPLSVEVAGKESQEVVKTDALAVSLAMGESKTVDHILALNLAEGVYTVTLKHLGNTVAQAEITAVKGLEKEKYVSRRPRLLIMNTLQLLYLGQKNYLKSVLTAAGIKYEDNANLIDSYFHYQKGENTISVVFGNLVSPGLKKELKERVRRGEGLVYIADSAVSDAVMEELSGVRVTGLLPGLREKGMTLLAGALGSGGTAVLKSKCKLGLTILVDGVETVAETASGKKPLAAFRVYGSGKVLTICAPLEFASGGDVFAQLLLNAVALLNSDVFSPSDLARVLPLELRIKNNTGAAKTFRVNELVPQNATAYGFDPQPLDGEGIKWDISLAVDEEKVISYWLQLPDTVGTYDVKSEIYEGEQKIDEALLTFEVTQKVVERVAVIATEIDAGGDAQAKPALPALQRIAGRAGTDALSLWLNLNDAIQAGDLVAASETAEAALWRRKLQNVILACARLFYEKAKDWSLLELSAFGTRFQE